MRFLEELIGDYRLDQYVTYSIHVLVVLVILCFGIDSVSAQVVDHDGNRLANRQLKAEQLFQRYTEQRNEALRRARGEGWAIRLLTDGRVSELMGLHGNRPVYYITDNRRAAISTAVDLVRYTSPFNLSGLGLTVGVWDEAAVRSTHQELAGRVTTMDSSGTGWHATHVAGTIAAAGVDSDAMGMAPELHIDSYDWDNDISEMTAVAADLPQQSGRLYLSNHSYGIVAGWVNGNYSGQNGYHWYGNWGDRESDSFGKYASATASWDEVCYEAPYYLPFKSAGNDRNDNHPSEGTVFYYYSGGWQSKSYNSATDPYSDGWDNGGYDTISYKQTAKNIMTVGAVSDAVSSEGTRSLDNASMTTFSGWGPTDDGRIKPDIVANGEYLYSCSDSSDTSYINSSGTSMSSPNACGSAALLIEYYNQLHPGSAMRSSTLKGLMIHTADDLGRPGPDYQFGWGLVNTKAGADLIYEHYIDPAQAIIVEDVLEHSGDVDQYTLYAGGETQMKATLCWTDPPGSSLSGLDNPTLTLVNDLDLRIIGPNGTDVYYPFILDPSQPANEATTGDNIRDNVEQVIIHSPVSEGLFTVEVNINDQPVNGSQHYSLIISTEESAPHSLNVEITSPGEVSLNWQHQSVGEAGYIVERKPYHGEKEWHELATFGPNTTSYVDSDSIAGSVLYTYRVGAF